MKHLLLTTLIVAALPCSGIFASAPHPFHVSVAEAEYNPQTGMLEVALRVYGVDLERTLTKQLGKPCDLDNKAQRDKLLKDYIARRFRAESISTKKKSPPQGSQKSDPKQNAAKRTIGRMNFVGSETEKADVWVYFELAPPVPGRGFALRNTVLTEVQPEQLNVVTLRTPSGRRTLYFSAKHETRSISLTPQGSR